jgi:hypothetical protein
LLDQDGASYRLDNAPELAERTVAHELDDPAVELADEGFEHLSAMSPQALEGAPLVSLHQARIANNIGREHGGEPAVSVWSGHSAAPITFERALPYRKSGDRDTRHL